MDASEVRVRFDLIEDEVGIGVKLLTARGLEVVYLARHPTQRVAMDAEQPSVVVGHLLKADHHVGASRIEYRPHRHRLFVQASANLLLKRSTLARIFRWRKHR